MNYSAVKEHTPLLESEPTPLTVREKTPLRDIVLHKGEEQAKSTLIVAEVTHYPESAKFLVETARSNNAKRAILENAPKSVIDVVEGRTPIMQHMREYILHETNGKIDIEKNPDALQEPRFAYHQARCEGLRDIKGERPDFEVLVVDPYYDKNAVASEPFKTYEDRMKFEASIAQALVKAQYFLEEKSPTNIRSAMEYVQNAARSQARQLDVQGNMRAKSIAEASLAGNSVVEIGEGHQDQPEKLKNFSKGSANVLVMQANKEIRSKIFKADENLQPPLLQLAHQYMIKGDEIDRQTEEVLSARACASMVLFERESERLLKEGKRMTAEKDAEIIKLVNSLQNVDDCIKICMG